MRSRLAAASGLVLALALTACNKHEVVTHGATEGIYVDVGSVQYQVQNSRLLNPGAIPEDRTFISGIPAAQRDLAADEGWFAVFVRAQNESEDRAPLARRFEIEDADGTVVRPVPLGTENPFRYTATTVAGEAIAPEPDSVAGQTSINGMELLFRVKLRSLDESRPFVLRIHAPAGKGEAEVDLDI